MYRDLMVMDMWWGIGMDGHFLKQLTDMIGEGIDGSIHSNMCEGGCICMMDFAKNFTRYSGGVAWWGYVMALGIETIILLYPWLLTLLFQNEVHTKLRGVVQCICSVH
jgi:hypothetical protein